MNFSYLKFGWVRKLEERVLQVSKGLSGSLALKLSEHFTVYSYYHFYVDHSEPASFGDEP